MTKKGNLFLLIKSLSKSEKRYFRIFAGISGRDSNYLQLFDTIDRQSEYDEEAIKACFKGEKFLSQFHVTKIYLTELILKALKNYHAKTSVNAELQDLLRDIEILFNKELYDLCYYKLQKAEAMADQYEKQAVLTEILSWKRKLTLAISGSRNEIISLLKKEKVAIEKMKTLNAYWHQTIHLFELTNDENFLKSISASKPMDSETLQSQVLRHHILYSSFFMKGNVKKAEKYISDLIHLLEQYPERIKDDPHSYVTAISNKTGLLLTDKRWDEIPALILKMREVPLKYKLEDKSRFTVRLWLRIFNLELEMYRDSHQLEKGIDLMDEIQEYIIKHEKAVPTDYLLLFYYQFANIFFLHKDYSKSLQWANRILNTNFGSVREDIQVYARILNLMIHFELNNIIVLRYAVDACKRFLKKKKAGSVFENKLMLLFSKLSHSSSEEYPLVFQKTYAELFSPSSPKQNQDFIDIRGWMEGKTGRQH